MQRSSLLASLVVSAAVVVAAGAQPGCSCGDSSMMNGGQDLSSVAGDGGDEIDLAGDDLTPPIFDGGVLISDDGGTFVCVQTRCNGKLLACGDCIDNDGDGRIDFRDPECLNPCDNTEGAVLAGGVGGQTGVTCKNDCYFDFGNGSGGLDECTWDHRCDPLAVAPNYPPAGPMCPYDSNRVGGRDCPSPQSQACQNFCRPLTPNGCDCFGCCTFPQLPQGSYVFLGSRDSSGAFTCTFADVTNPDKCKPCTPQGSCFNDCGRCELCIGKTSIPPDCVQTPDGGSTSTDMAGQSRCDPGVQPCGLPTDPECPAGSYCITGCCINSPIF
jgi:hypothetical protein